MAFLRLRLSRDPLWSHFPRPGPSSPVDLEDDVQPKKRQALDTAERLGIPPGQFHGQFKGDQDICPCSSKEVSVASYFQARGIPADLADAVAAACDVKRLRRSQIRDLAHALARRPELRDELVAGDSDPDALWRARNDPSVSNPELPGMMPFSDLKIRPAKASAFEVPGARSVRVTYSVDAAPLSSPEGPVGYWSCDSAANCW
eukprot:s5136_g2.t2